MNKPEDFMTKAMELFTGLDADKIKSLLDDGEKIHFGFTDKDGIRFSMEFGNDSK